MDAETNKEKPILYARFDRSFGFEFALLIFFCPPLIALWGFVAYYYYLNGAVSMPILKVAVYYTAAFACARYLYGNSRVSRKGMGVVLDGERIIKKGVGGVGMLEYADIRGVRCTRNPLFNKKMVIALAAGKMTLPLNLSGSYKMAETIFEKLTANGETRSLSEAETRSLSEAEMRGIYLTALQYNALYRLRGRHIWFFAALAAAAAFFCGGVALLYWERELATALPLGVAGMLFQTLGYFAAERLWARRMFVDAGAGGVKGVKSVNDGDGYELFKTIHAATALAALLAVMLAGIAVTSPAL